MTNEQTMKAFEMRLQGKGYTEIGGCVGVSSVMVRKKFNRVVNGRKMPADCKYPVLWEYVKGEFGGIRKADKEIGFCVNEIIKGKAKKEHREELSKRYNVPVDELFEVKQ